MLTVPVLVGLAVVVGVVEWPRAPVALGPSGSADAGAESRASLTSPSPPLRHTVSPGAYHYGNDGVMADASPAGCAIQGEVRDSLGRPIPGVKVAVIDQRRRSIAASGCSDSQGRFAVEGLECSRFVVMPELDRQTSEWIAPFYGDGWPLEAIEDSAALLAPVVVLTEREPRGEAVVTLYRKASVSGVVTASGRPVESAVVRLEPKKFPAFALDVVSDRGGAERPLDIRSRLATHPFGKLRVGDQFTQPRQFVEARLGEGGVQQIRERVAVTREALAGERENAEQIRIRTDRFTRHVSGAEAAGHGRLTRLCAQIVEAVDTDFGHAQCE